MEKGKKRGQHNDFILFQRGIRATQKRTATSLYWYVQYRNEEGKQLTPVSTRQTTKSAAMTWAVKNKSRMILKDREGKGNNLKKILSEFYLPGSKYLLQLAKRNSVISETHRKHCYSHCVKHFIPFFEQEGITSFVDISRITIINLQDWLAEEKGFKNKTINNVTSSLKNIINYLIYRGMITSDPFVNLQWMAESYNARTRGVFPKDKVKNIFHVEWEDKQQFILNLLGASCGLRNSEIDFLQVSSIIKGKYNNFLNIVNSHSDGTGTKTPAGVRRVPLHPFVEAKLREYICMHELTDNDYLFLREGKQLYYKVYGQAVKKAGSLIGFDEDYLQCNFISFYSWRHFFNSLMIDSGINPLRVKMVMGHKLPKGTDMTANYYHGISDDYSDFIKALDPLFT